ncbi:MAG: ATP-grasp domain-containing protein [Bdellovibrionaceae bacterium]|nr:ATP-grasp domain-containing protein [Pseudobdellovibrionaceae bacterium]
MKETVLDSDFLILNRIPSLYSARRFAQEIAHLKLNGHLISPEKLSDYLPQFETSGLRPAILYRQGEFRFWETHHLISRYPGRVINAPQAFLESRDKWRTYVSWKKNNIPFPTTFKASEFASEYEMTAANIFHVVQGHLGLPFILKKRMSSQGREVFKIQDQQQWNAILEKDFALFETVSQPEFTYFKNENTNLSTYQLPLSRWLVQECIQESLGQDVRCFQLTSQQFPIARQNEHSFLSNLHRGGQAKRTELTETEQTLATRVHQLSGLNYSGIDFLRSSRGPQFLEINPSPGFEGIEQTYTFNVAREIVLLVNRLHIGTT